MVHEELEGSRLLDRKIGRFCAVRRGQSVKTRADLAGKRVAVAADTTNETVLREVLLGQVVDGGEVTTDVVLVTDHRQGLDALVRGSIDAVAADRMVLARLAQEAPDPQQLSLADYQFAYEPLALRSRARAASAGETGSPGRRACPSR